MMKKKTYLRIIGIGALHTLLYLWLVPFVIYPRFGDNGLALAVVSAILISIVIIGTLFIGKKNNRNDPR